MRVDGPTLENVTKFPANTVTLRLNKVTNKFEIEKEISRRPTRPLRRMQIPARIKGNCQSLRHFAWVFPNGPSSSTAGREFRSKLTLPWTLWMRIDLNFCFLNVVLNYVLLSWNCFLWSTKTVGITVPLFHFKGSLKSLLSIICLLSNY